ncbi:MAG: alpha/beta hydrolase [Saprospiraceae bacterium]
MNYLEISKGQKVAYQLAGKPIAQGSAPLVLLHGFCEDSRLWDPILPFLTDLPIILIDMPGFGESDMPKTNDMHAYSAVISTVLDNIGVQKCVLVGHSMGGYAALDFASKHSARLHGIGLFHSHPYADDEARKDIRKRGMEMLASGKRDLYISQLFNSLFSPEFAAKNPEILRIMIERGKLIPPASIAAALETMMNRESHLETLANLPCPVLFLTGDIDHLVPLDQTWKAAMLPKTAQVSILESVAHMGMFESTKKSAMAIVDFYKMAVAG